MDGHGQATFRLSDLIAIPTVADLARNIRESKAQARLNRLQPGADPEPDDDSPEADSDSMTIVADAFGWGGS